MPGRLSHIISGALPLDVATIAILGAHDHLFCCQEAVSSEKFAKAKPQRLRPPGPTSDGNLTRSQYKSHMPRSYSIRTAEMRLQGFELIGKKRGVFGCELHEDLLEGLAQLSKASKTWTFTTLQVLSAQTLATQDTPDKPLGHLAFRFPSPWMQSLAASLFVVQSLRICIVPKFSTFPKCIPE